MSVPTPRNIVTPVQVFAPEAARELAGPRDEVVARDAAFATRWGRLEAAVASSRGLRHAVNEDCHSPLDGTAPLFVVADGVGGGALASRASRELVSRMHAALEGAPPDAENICAALLDADRAIGRSIASRTHGAGAATVALCTGTGAALSRWLIAWVGDCRVYGLKANAGDTAELLTVDDTYRQLHEQPPAGGSPDDPARMIGNGAVDAPNVRRVALGTGDMLVLCSDGVHKHADPGDIGRLLRGPEPLSRRCMRVIDLARSRGSHDDATVLVVHRAHSSLGPFARAIAAALLVTILAGAALWLATRETAAAPTLSSPSLPSLPSSGVQA